MFIRTPILFAIPLVLFLFIGLFLSVGHVPAAADSKTAVAPQSGSVDISIDYGDGSSKVVPTTQFERGEMVLAILKRAFAAGSVGFGARDYGDGIVITEINNHINGTGDRYWEYRVNGMRQSSGINRYRLIPGDTLELRFAVYGGE